MPNIELHGFEPQLASDVRNVIFGKARRSSLEEELVVTFSDSDPRDWHGRKSPFMRVFYEREKERRGCLDILQQVPNARKCFFDVEFVQVADFCSIPPKTA